MLMHSDTLGGLHFTILHYKVQLVPSPPLFEESSPVRHSLCPLLGSSI